MSHPSWILFLDDIRSPSSTLDILGPRKIARNSNEAIELIKEFGMPTKMELDYILSDGGLSENDTSLAFLGKLEGLVLQPGLKHEDKPIRFPHNFTYKIHSKADPYFLEPFELVLKRMIERYKVVETVTTP
jgi:hypothetical protein